MEGSEEYVNERLDHLGIVAGVCQEIGLAAWLDGQEPGSRKPRECGNGDSSDGVEWVRHKSSAIVFSPTVLRQQAARTFAGTWNRRRDARVSIAWGAAWIGCTPTI